MSGGNTLWHGRFEGGPAASLMAFTESLSFDRRLWLDDNDLVYLASLVTGGVFALTRNPMYLGVLLVLLAWAIYLTNILTLLFLPGFVWYMDRFQIEPEERALTSLFGPEFTAYAARVRRWL